MPWGIIAAVRDEDSRRPWGYYEVLVEASSYKVKRIVVAPGQRLSLQRHHHRQEHWYFVQGQGVVTVEQEERAVGPAAAVDIPRGAAHRVANTAALPLVFIEVQTGSYLGEDDIERLADDFGRA